MSFPSIQYVLFYFYDFGDILETDIPNMIEFFFGEGCFCDQKGQLNNTIEDLFLERSLGIFCDDKALIHR